MNVPPGLVHFSENQGKRFDLSITLSVSTCPYLYLFFLLRLEKHIYGEFESKYKFQTFHRKASGCPRCSQLNEIIIEPLVMLESFYCYID